MQFVKTIKKDLDSICIYSKQIIVFSFWCSIILFAIALIFLSNGVLHGLSSTNADSSNRYGGSSLLFFCRLYCGFAWRPSHRSYQKK